MRVLPPLVAVLLALSGCGPAATGGADIPPGFELQESLKLASAAECEGLVRDRTKGGVPEPVQGRGVTTYEQTLNSGRRIWQSCTVDSHGGVLYIMAAAP